MATCCCEILDPATALLGGQGVRAAVFADHRLGAYRCDAIDVVGSMADGSGAVAWAGDQGFFAGSRLGLGLRGTAAINLGFVLVWIGVASRLRTDRYDVAPERPPAPSR